MNLRLFCQTQVTFFHVNLAIKQAMTAGFLFLPELNSVSAIDSHFAGFVCLIDAFVQIVDRYLNIFFFRQMGS